MKLAAKRRMNMQACPARALEPHQEGARPSLDEQKTRSALRLHVQVINLDSSTDRMNRIRGDLALANLPFERLPATDGSDLSCADLSAYKWWKAILYYGRTLTHGEIGCYRSHLRAASRFLESNCRYGLVLEDDATIAPDTAERLEALIAAMERSGDGSWDLINLGNAPKRPEYCHAIEEVGEGSRLVRAKIFPKRTTAILWSAKGAKWFVEHGQEIYAPVDQFLHMTLSDSQTGYALVPPLLPHNGDPSIINQTAEARKIRQVGSKNHWFKFRGKMRRRASRKHVQASAALRTRPKGDRL